MALHLKGTTLSHTFWLLVFLEAMSFLGFAIPAVNVVIFILILLATGFAMVRSGLLAGVLVLFAELTIGSKGYLFSLTVGEVRISIRLALFLLVMGFWLADAVRQRSVRLRSTPLLGPLLLFGAVLASGAIRGVLEGNAVRDVFFDGNGYLYAAVALPLFQAIQNRRSLRLLGEVMLAGLFVLSLKTLFVLTFFSHETGLGPLRAVYRWIRITGVGEMTQLAGDYYRIFFQSHIAHLVAFLGALTMVSMIGKNLTGRLRRLLIATLLLASLTLMISFSRSFWFGLALAILTLFGLLRIQERLPLKRLLGLALILVLLGVIDLGIIAGLVNFPLPGRGGAGVSPASLIEERLRGVPTEAAATSRLLLVDPLIRKIGEHPLTGSGLGTLVTAQTRDPRTRVINEGLYTTYAFEWGYLDFLVKFGVLGTVGLLILFFAVSRMGWRTLRQLREFPVDRAITFGCLLGLLGLLLTHVTTPYLNHPLGLGITLVAAVTFSVLGPTRRNAPRVNGADE